MDEINRTNTSGITEKIKFISILEFAPSFLISKIGNLRNKVEHKYILPMR